MVQAIVFVGAISNSTKGGWIRLPVSEHELKTKIENLRFSDEEFEIIDIETDLPISFNSYRDVFHLNRDLQIFDQYEKAGLLNLLMTAYCYRDEDLDDAVNLINTGNYEYYEGVSDLKSLGEAVVNRGKFGWLLANPKESEFPEVKEMAQYNLLQLDIVSQYLDYEAIGNDWNLNGCTIFPSLKTAIMETPA